MPTNAFYAHLADLVRQAGRIGAAAAVPGVVARPWQIPAAYPTGTDVQDPAGFISACDREELNQLAVDSYVRGNIPNDPIGRIGVLIAAKIAIDSQGSFERALHARHASPVRLRAWSAARRAGHSDGTFGVFGTTGRYIASLLSQANSAPNSQT